MTESVANSLTSPASPQKPQVWVLAGGNGAGKSTFYQSFLAPHGVKFVNADLLAKKIAPAEPELASYDAAKIAEYLRYDLLAQFSDFCFETVFSHSSEIDFIADAKIKGYEIILVFIHLETDELNLARVSQRVAQGGHNVPTEKVISRIPRTLKAIKKVLPLLDEFHLLDNSSAENPFKRLAVIKNQQLITAENPLPTWARELLNCYSFN